MKFAIWFFCFGKYSTVFFTAILSNMPAYYVCLIPSQFILGSALFLCTLSKTLLTKRCLCSSLSNQYMVDAFRDKSLFDEIFQSISFFSLL